MFPTDFTTLLIGLVVLGVTVYWRYRKSQYKLPPGPSCLPLVGYLPFIGKKPFEDFKQLSEKYGNVFGLYLGRSYTVVLNDFKSMKEAYIENALLDRPPNASAFFPGTFGFADSNGSDWSEQRRYSMRAMRDIGMGKGDWEKMVEAEVDDFAQFLLPKNGKPVDYVDTLFASVSNNITSLLIGKRLPVGDPGRNVIDQGAQAVTSVFASSGLAIAFPGLLQFVAKLGISSYASVFQKMLAFTDYIRKEVEHHRRRLADGIDDDSFIGGYFNEIKKNKENNVKSSLDENSLTGDLHALILAGSETTKTSLTWLFLIMASFPDVQKKVQEEIDSVLGRDGKCNWSERSKLPYTNATIMECQRFRTVAPLGVMHHASENTTLCGYNIPKGSNIIANQWAVHNDPNYWKEPEKFIPERFLQEDGKVMTKKPDGYVPFSIGRRNCPGDFISLIELFHYTTSILQKFQVLPATDHQPPSLDGVMGEAYSPVPQELRFVTRD